MSLTAPMRCSALAEQLGEPMIGSVDVRRRWLLLEDRSAWGSHAVRDVLGHEFEAAAKKRGVRALLIRQREPSDASASASRRAFVVDTEAASAVSFVVDDLGSLDAATLAEAPLAELGEPWAEPIILVCTNGRRDACCALRGRAVMGALADSHGERTWECTHLGGHRFAGNLVCLPHGFVYGRVGPTDAPRLVDAYLAGRVDPAWLRGRSAWPAPAQVAEQLLRVRLDLDGVDDVRLVSADGGSVVLATADGTTHAFDLVEERLEPRPISCRADELETPVHWRPA